jgi:hypothetical protein
MSESTGFGLGIIIAVFGPLLLIPAVFIIARWPLRRWAGKWANQRFGSDSGVMLMVMAAVVVAVIVLASYLPGRMEYEHLCEVHAPVITEVTDAPGFYVTELYAYQAENFLREWGFSYVEAPDMYKEGRILRYEVGNDGKTIVTEIAAPTSRYTVSDTTRKLGNTLVLHEKRIFETATGREMAHAGGVTYHGGYLHLVLGVYGMSSCPSPGTAKESQQFGDNYYLVRKVLRTSFVPKSGRPSQGGF